MSEELTDTIALWLLLPSMAVVVLIAGARAWGTPWGTRRRRKSEQLDRLRELARSTEPTLEFDWVPLREIPHAELCRELSRNGWRHVADEPGERAWMVRFARESDVRG